MGPAEPDRPVYSALGSAEPGAGKTAAPAKRVALATRVASLPGLSRSHFGRPRRVNHEIRRSRPSWSTWCNPVSTENTKISWAWWCAPVVQATWESEAGELLEYGRQRLRNMFDKLNRDAFHIVSYFLFQILDQSLTKEVFKVSVCHQSWSAVVPSCLTAASTCWVQAIVVPQLPKDGIFHVGQTGLKLLASSDLRASSTQEGGVESAFHKTSGAPAALKKLYQVKGKKNIHATEWALSWDSFNMGDCFILDLGQNIFAWCGGKSNILERNKARDLALAIQDGERQDKAQVEIVTYEEEPAEMIQVLGPKPSLKEGNPEEDLTADQTNAQATALYKVSDTTGQMNLTKVADSSPFVPNC
ncbi:Macrophage-capping protein [Plecturocebus cupreus]